MNCDSRFITTSIKQMVLASCILATLPACRVDAQPHIERDGGGGSDLLLSINTLPPLAQLSRADAATRAIEIEQFRLEVAMLTRRRNYNLITLGISTLVTGVGLIMLSFGLYAHVRLANAGIAALGVGMPVATVGLIGALVHGTKRRRATRRLASLALTPAVARSFGGLQLDASW